MNSLDSAVDTLLGFLLFIVTFMYILTRLGNSHSNITSDGSELN